ncbi:putative sulfate exporter family transporter [Stappia sp.]|uniref:YeiH family protein n=1 Tax=Stappia sp. TaxID=1870903 RepID=UPI0032D926FE
MTFPTLRARAAAPLYRLAPGVLLALVIGAAAGFLSDHYGGPAMLFALLIGMAFNFTSEDARFAPGIGFSSRTLLRLGVALLGARVTASEIAGLGWQTGAAVAGLIALTIATGFLACRLFGRGWRFAILTGGSVAICGASAALAISAALPVNDKLERNTLFTVIAVTTLSTVAMVLYPLIFTAFDFSHREIGFLIGATIHDVAQVVGAGYLVSEETGELATIVKLLRVSLLPVVLIVLLLALRGTNAGGSGAAPRLPGFVIGFAVLAALNSFGLLPALVVTVATEVSRLLLVTAIAALGVKTALGAMTRVGGGHIGIVVTETVVLAGAASALVAFGLLTF